MTRIRSLSKQRFTTRQRLRLAHNLVSSADFDKAISMYRKLLRHHGADTALSCEALTGLAEAFWLQRKTTFTVKYLKIAVTYSPENIDLHGALGLAYGWAGDWVAALFEFKECAERRGRRDDYYLLAWAFWKSGDQQLADEAIKTASRPGKDDGDAERLAVDIFQISDIDQALSYSWQVLTDFPTLGFYMQVFRALLRLKRLVKKARAIDNLN